MRPSCEPSRVGRRPPSAAHPDRADRCPAAPAPLRTRWWVELGAAATVAIVYLSAAPATPSAEVIAHATERADRLHDLERSLGLHLGPTLQALVGDLGLQGLANLLYGSLHFVVTAAVFVVVFRRRPDRYGRWRTAFVLTSVTAFVVQRLVPVAPPRLVPAADGSMLANDWLAQHPSLWDFRSGPISEAANHYAAMPSMHVGWATLCSVGLVWALGSAWSVRAMAVGYTVLVSFVVVVTGNHFVLDVVGGVLVAATGILLVTAMRPREHAPPS